MIIRILIATAIALVENAVAVFIGIKYDCVNKDLKDIKQSLFLGANLVITIGLNALLLRMGLTIPEITNFFLVSTIMQSIAIIDSKTKTIPNLLLLIGLGLRVLTLIAEWIMTPETIIDSLIFSGAGLVICLLVMLVISFISKHGIGYGDVKLYAYLGACIGVMDAYYVLFYAALIAALYAAYLILVKKEKKGTKISFGPFTYFGFILVYLFSFING